ncbi:MAG: MiaB/RimO family radical SAM methylthiotransferase [Chloroflexi bacterium]|nr:MiaB/RimO family radical SAM methylthiotransferase [Chloroflexota bacterium]
MASYYIWTIGCQMNKADSERVKGLFDSWGLAPAPDVQSADTIVLNSCVVRQKAENRVVSKIGSLAALKRKRPDASIIVIGCLVDGQTDELRRLYPHVDAFFKAGEYGDIAAWGVSKGLGGANPPVSPFAKGGRDMTSLFARGREDLPSPFANGGENPSVSPFAKGGRGMTSLFARRGEDLPSPFAKRGENPPESPFEKGGQKGDSPVAYVPVIHGCDNFCSYCIVPYRRGREKSRPAAEIISEVRGMAARGVREVTLVGQNVDSYGHDLPEPADLAVLLQELNEIEGLYRLRFLTSHPKDMTLRLIRMIAGMDKVCRHINLPVQSGNDEILKAMRRGYTSANYRKLIEEIRRFLPDAALSTDVIVGFPGETEEQFLDTYRLLEEVRFDAVHVAAYSPRAGTLASRTLKDDVPVEVKMARLQRVEALQEKVAGEINSELAGKTVEVLVEKRAGEKWSGRTRSNKLVFFEAGGDLVGKLVCVRIDRTSPWSLTGEPILAV